MRSVCLVYANSLCYRTVRSAPEINNRQERTRLSTAAKLKITLIYKFNNTKICNAHMYCGVGLTVHAANRHNVRCSVFSQAETSWRAATIVRSPTCDSQLASCKMALSQPHFGLIACRHRNTRKHTRTNRTWKYFLIKPNCTTEFLKGTPIIGDRGIEAIHRI